ncbi:MAG: T9SS type A sorting domain-containing protein [Saprospiraceae bacterium]|nr:T9SS type A sorting domain-containing protein [Saprospiraceae bacterium]HPG06195.1 T9SS type A sorting domain-containing protein [Saprospiraceae bacterium]HPQ98669.1 T9SS type A sorting domain-containing protein [Saprospiraceae bacterium]HQU53456.1 T9SS type A sorting domain-containing protein [Saprospiraceae bacterium]
MKGYLHLLATMLLLSFLAPLKAQVCIPDTMALDSGSIIAPRPYIEGDSTSGIKKAACQGESYELVFTMFIPDVVVNQGFPLALNYAQLNPTTAVKGLPAGLTYTCNPEDCKMLALQYGCVVLSGTIDDTVTVGSYDLTIDLTLGTVLGPIEARVPGPLFPGVYSIEVRETGQCEEVSSIEVEPQVVSKFKLKSNPLTPSSTLTIFTDQESRTTITIYDLMGRVTSQRKVQLAAGMNEFPVFNETLAAGTYFIAVGEGKQVVTKKVMVLP